MAGRGQEGRTIHRCISLLSLLSESQGESPRVPKTPRVVELLRKANEWKALLESGEVASQAEIAHQEGVSRARVTQIMGMLRLAPEIQERILVTPDTIHKSLITERVLRPIGSITDCCDQIREVQGSLL